MTEVSLRKGDTPDGCGCRLNDGDRTRGWKYRTGLVLLGLSWIPWLAVATVPFLGQSLFTSTALIAALIAVGDALFIASLLLLGKPFWTRMTRRVMRLWERASRG